MTGKVPHRGGAPVGLIEELGPIEASAVAYLRMWSDGPKMFNAIDQDFATALGTDNGKKLSVSFHRLCNMCAVHGRRPLMRHELNCRCLGADESCFANFIGYASEGAREDALMMAMTLVSAEKAPLLAGLAEDFGLALRQMSMRFQPNKPTRNVHTLH